MMRITTAFLFGLILVSSAFAAPEPEMIKAEKGDLTIRPIFHGSLVLQWDGKTIYIDPAMGADRYKDLPAADLILVTDIHGDHADPETFAAVAKADTPVIAPQAVAEKLKIAGQPRTTVLANGKSIEMLSIGVEAIPMYNLTAERLKFHDKGRGNGYVITFGGKRVYVCGDTEDVPEMRALKNIDVAFICMNLPYTMVPEQAASAVLEFKPKVVYPYHYRGAGNVKSDVEQFKTLVAKDPSIEVRLRDWYGK